METTTVPDHVEQFNKSATPEEVWALIREVSEIQRRSSLEWDKKWEKASEERAKARAERDKASEEREKARKEREKARKERDEEWNRKWEKLRKAQKRNDKKMGFLTNRFGELAEHLVAPRIHTRFNELGYFFGEVAPGGYRIIENDKIKTEIDLLLENGETVMAVEVKVKPAMKDVGHHIKRLEILRDSRRKKNDHRKIQGAIAGAIFGSEEKKAVIEAGLYVIEQSGDTMKIDIPDGFVPREW